MTAVLAMVALAAACWVLRAAFVLAVPGDRLPAWAQESLEHLAPAVLASVAAVELVGLVRHAGAADLAATAMMLAVVAIVAVRTRNLSLVCVVGLLLVLALDITPGL